MGSSVRILTTCLAAVIVLVATREAPAADGREDGQGEYQVGAEAEPATVDQQPDAGSADAEHEDDEMEGAVEEQQDSAPVIVIYEALAPANAPRRYDSTTQDMAERQGRRRYDKSEQDLADRHGGKRYDRAGEDLVERKRGERYDVVGEDLADRQKGRRYDEAGEDLPERHGGHRFDVVGPDLIERHQGLRYERDGQIKKRRFDEEGGDMRARHGALDP